MNLSTKSSKIYFKILNILLLLLLLFNVIFPKGGIKLAEFPITIGYLIFFILFIHIFIGTLISTRTYVNNKFIMVHIILIICFNTIVLLGVGYNGYDDLGMLVSMIINLFLIPIIFLLFLNPLSQECDIEKYLNFLKNGIMFVSIYGIFLFFYKYYTGAFIEIPLLTVNYHDVGLIESTKSIDRGGVFKLISTYNNGNIYGVCILMLLPLYVWLEKSKIKKFLVKTSLILTLSRTVWIGLVLYEFFVFIKSKLTFQRVLTLLLIVSFLVFSIYTIMIFLNWDLSLLFDTDLGGRRKQLDFVFSFFPIKSFYVTSEITYVFILSIFGLIGLLFFILIMTFPIILWYLGKIPNRMKFKKHIVHGLILYLIVSFGDGAILYIPVMMIYWFLVFMLYSNHKQALAIDNKFHKNIHYENNFKTDKG